MKGHRSDLWRLFCFTVFIGGVVILPSRVWGGALAHDPTPTAGTRYPALFRPGDVLSLGGMVAALVLARTDIFRSAALWSAAVRLPFLESLSPAQLNRWRQRGYLNLDGMNLGWAFLGDLSRHRPLAAIASSSVPVLVVHGSGFGQFGEGHVRMVFLPPIEVLEEALDRVERFVKRHAG